MTIEQRVSTVEQAIVLLTATVTNMDKRLELLESRVDSIDKRLDLLVTAVANMDKRLDLLTIAVTNMDKRLELLESRMDGMEARQSSTDARLSSIEDLLREANEQAERRHTGRLEALKRATPQARSSLHQSSLRRPLPSTVISVKAPLCRQRTESRGP